MQIDRGTRAEVNLDAIANNIHAARKNLKDTTMLCAVVKANGYGHGAVPVAKACDEA
ncbi:MAG: alanine racemase, partial [Acidaminococcaceae bacterium]|nr:alanine racemase [Acidaminococcaceae bacterium]